jgi:hypothetical protein
MLFWPRLEIFPSFVLSELHRFLFVRQNRLEMGRNSHSLRPDQSQKRKLALRECAPFQRQGKQYESRGDSRERNNNIEHPFLCQGERVTARLPFVPQGKPFEAQGKKPCPDVTRSGSHAPARLRFAAQGKPFADQGKQPWRDVTHIVQF